MTARAAARGLAFVRYLSDESALYVPVMPGFSASKVGRVDALVNAYRIAAGNDGAGRLISNKG